MKITIVAFDLWSFNKKVADYLVLQGNEVTFIDSDKINFIYKNKRQRIGNFFRKLFLGKNIKKNYRNIKILEIINQLPKQDAILIVNPYQFHNEIVVSLRKKTQFYIAHNYDSLTRIPLPTNYKQLFDKVFSFDIEDVKLNADLNFLTNFIYLDQQVNESCTNKAFIILSKSIEREKILSIIADTFDKKGIHNYEFIVAHPETRKVNKNIKLTNHHIDLESVISKMKDSEILIDLVRPKQTGLSFRIFEAMALHKKIITNNKSITQYDFYNPNNILVIDNQNIDLPDAFLNAKYQEIPEEIYHKYTLQNWVQTVFYNNNKK